LYKNIVGQAIAIIIPCYNEASTICKVVSDFKAVLPEAQIYVYDNNSNDNTAIIARDAGAIVKREYQQGKGNVIRTMFSQIEADVYLMVDGDDTYPSESAKELIQPIIDGIADMTIGDRLSNGTYTQENKRTFHNFGNSLVRFSINHFFNGNLNDIMTGYRGFSRKFVKNFPVMCGGFELETEMSLHALDKRFPIIQVPVVYRDRPEGSYSKLNTIRDGFRVLSTIFNMFKDYRPMVFFGLIAFFLFLLGLASGYPVVIEYARVKYITHVPLAVLASGLEISSIIFFACGLILDTIVNANKREYEWKLIQYETRRRSCNANIHCR